VYGEERTAGESYPAGGQHEHPDEQVSALPAIRKRTG